MSTSAAGTFFQDMTPAVQAAQPAATTPAKPADSVAPAVAVVANTDPGKAVALDSTSHSIAPNQSLWYRFDLSGSDGSMAILSLPGAGGSALRFEVYSAGQATNWWSESPVGSGNLDDNNNSVWATT